MNLHDKVAIVTGGTKGIGRGIAEALARAGAGVIIAARRSEEIEQTVHDLETMGEVSLLDLGTGSVRVDPNVERVHHHLICVRCGKVRDVIIDVTDVRVSARERQGFTVHDVEVHFRGVCEECAADSSASRRLRS